MRILRSSEINYKEHRAAYQLTPKKREGKNIFSMKLGDSSNGEDAYMKQSVKIKSSQRPSATSTTMSRRVLSSSVSRASLGCTDAFRSPIELASPAVILSLREPSFVWRASENLHRTFEDLSWDLEFTWTRGSQSSSPKNFAEVIFP